MSEDKKYDLYDHQKRKGRDMKKKIYTLELLQQILDLAKEKNVFRYSDNDDKYIQRFLDILRMGEMAKESGLEVIIVKRKNGKFIK